MSTHLEKFRVCKSCLSVHITELDCVCGYTNRYPTVELEFEVCDCCGQLISDGSPADSEFNNKQLDD